MIGQMIGSYKVTRKLGEGGMGAVYEGIHDQLGRRAAIKVLHPHTSQDPQMAQRFFNEAKAVNVIDHPGLVDIYEFGHLPDGTAYIIMEFLKGESLAARLARCGRLTPQDTLRLAKQLAAALAAAHAKAIVHRDLKPDNVMIVPDPNAAYGERAKVLDFGIAKLADGGQGKGMEVKTRTGAMMGTPLYMSPEQCLGTGTVDDRSDVYSLGVMLYQMLTGQPPFTSEGLGELVVKHIMEPARPLRELVPDLSPAIEALVLTMLAKTPAQRPSMVQVVSQVNQLGQNLPGWSSTLEPTPGVGASYPTGPDVLPVPHPSTLGQAAGQRPLAFLTTGGAGDKGGGRSRALIVSAAAGLLVVGTVMMALPKRSPPVPGTVVTKPGAAGPTEAGVQRMSFPDGMTMETGKIDDAHLDLSAYYKVALDDARQRMPDATLTMMIAGCVQPNGIANLSLCGGTVMYTFRSPANSARGNTPIGVRRRCLVQVIIQPPRRLVVQYGTSEKCDEKIVGTPRCQATEIWRRAIKDGAPEDAVAQFIFNNGSWYVTIADKGRSFPDNC